MEVCVKCNKELPENNPLCPNCGFRNLSLTDTKYDNSKKLILVEGDSFTMGYDTGLDIEKPSHPVTVSSFYISKYAVTQTEWIEIMDNNPSDIEGDLFPVENISWLDAILYCNKRSIKENLEPCYLINCDEALDEYDMKSSKLQNMLQKFGWKSLEVLCDFDKNGYRLPTEAEWEFAMRGGKLSNNFQYSGSNDLDEVAWYIGNSDYTSHPVGIKKPNELGLYDMSGNVYEWCWDIFGNYTSESLVNPTGPNTGHKRVFRGGSWSSKKEYCTVSNRYFNEENQETFNIGMRVVRSSI